MLESTYQMLYEVIYLEILIVTLILLLIFVLLALLSEKYVVVPSLTVIVDKPQYARGDTVTISGTLKENDTPQGSVAVAITVKDPAETPTTLSATTDTNGNYTAAYVIPDTAPGGSFTVSATALGTTATTTFTSRMKHPPKRDNNLGT